MLNRPDPASPGRSGAVRSGWPGDQPPGCGAGGGTCAGSGVTGPCSTNTRGALSPYRDSNSCRARATSRVPTSTPAPSCRAPTLEIRTPRSAHESQVRDDSVVPGGELGQAMGRIPHHDAGVLRAVPYEVVERRRRHPVDDRPYPLLINLKPRVTLRELGTPTGVDPRHGGIQVRRGDQHRHVSDDHRLRFARQLTARSRPPTGETDRLLSANVRRFAAPTGHEDRPEQQAAPPKTKPSSKSIVAHRIPSLYRDPHRSARSRTSSTQRPVPARDASAQDQIPRPDHRAALGLSADSAAANRSARRRVRSIGEGRHRRRLRCHASRRPRSRPPPPPAATPSPAARPPAAPAPATPRPATPRPAPRAGSARSPLSPRPAAARS